MPSEQEQSVEPTERQKLLMAADWLESQGHEYAASALTRWVRTGSNQMNADKALMPEAAVGPWRPIEEVALWDVAVVTDGENVALAQKAESDNGTSFYWAIEPEDGLDWVPTHYVPPLSQSLTTPTPVKEPANAATGCGYGVCTRCWRSEHCASIAATNAGQVEAAAKVISRYTYALPANDPADCGEWEEMSETARNVYRIAAKAALATFKKSEVGHD